LFPYEYTGQSAKLVIDILMADLLASIKIIFFETAVPFFL
jgi:hypothetical protein